MCLPERVTIHKLLELVQYARIQVGKTQVWNRGGHVPPWSEITGGRRACGSGCGEEEGSQTTNKGSECWASLLCKPSSCPPPRSTRLRTHPVCSGLAERVVRPPLLCCHPTYGIHPMKWLSLLQPTTKPVGSASQSCWAFPGTQTALGGPMCQHIGPVGRTACE